MVFEASFVGQEAPCVFWGREKQPANFVSLPQASFHARLTLLLNISLF